MKLISKLISKHRIHQYNRWKTKQIHNNRDAYRLGFRKAGKYHE